MPATSAKKTVGKSGTSARRAPAASSARRKSKTRAVTPPGKKASAHKKNTTRVMPLWLRIGLTVCIVCVFSALFYYFFVRPYAYRWKPCYGMKGYGVCLPYGFDVHGIDISHYQGTIDWPRLASLQDGLFPLRFIFLKATEGGDHQDHMFRQNFDSARCYGFVRGAYHYFLPRTDAAKQANFFIHTVELEQGDLPPVLDVETTGNKSPQELKAAVKTWLDCVEAHYGVKPILYTSYKFKMRYLNDSVFNTYPYWIAHYYVDSVRYQGPWHFWQHTDVGTVPGIDEEVDLDVFNGSLAQLDSLCIR